MLQSVGRITVCALGLTFAVSACGGGGGGGESTGPPPPNPLYVRISGHDTNSGGDPNDALGSISKAAQIAQSGYEIVVGPGTYVDGVNAARVGTMPQALTFTADVGGTRTGDKAGPVIIDATGSPVGAGFSLSNTPGSTIDGFTIAGGADAGIVIKSGSTDFVIRNCVVANNPGDGIRVQDSSSVLVFNNIVYANGGMGVGIVGQISGSPDAQVYSNTIFGNGNRGITIGNSKAASPGAMVHNNIVQNNGNGSNPPLENIKVFTNPRSDLRYDGDYNLVFPGTYLPPDSIRGSNDINIDAKFVNSNADNFHLQPTSPAIDMGGPLAGLPNSEAQILRARTTTGTNLDTGALDMGFHFLRTQ